ncbi:trans-sialidase [Trypanosoma cruzi]|nr:trans-sialidase [Trypanosoma cruzi]
MLVGKYSRKAATGVQERDAVDRGFLLVKGEVGGEESGSGKGIQWKDTKGLPRTPFCEQHEFLTGLVGGGGSGVKIKDGTLVFPVEGTKKKENEGTEEDKKTVFADHIHPEYCELDAV